MQYLVSFLEGIITFISPCLLPMLPVYVTYFAGGKERNTKGTLKNAFGFVLGFTVVFVLMGALAGTIGSFLNKYQTLLNILSGIIVIIFGLNFLGVFKFKIFNGSVKTEKTKNLGFFSSFVFGTAFSIGWTPCVGAFLGSALMLASQQGHITQGIIMLLLYSAGLGIPFIMSAVLIDKLKGAFNFIKAHYKTVNIISGVLLILVGLLMATGLMNGILNILN